MQILITGIKILTFTLQHPKWKKFGKILALISAICNQGAALFTMINEHSAETPGVGWMATSFAIAVFLLVSDT
jgi:hypothetical protein